MSCYQINDDGPASTLTCEGLRPDSTNGEIAGRVGYRPRN